VFHRIFTCAKFSVPSLSWGDISFHEVASCNRSFDHVFATDKPVNENETVLNLLSQKIVNADGTPGPAYAKAQQVLPNPVTFGNPYVPVNSPAIGDLMDAFDFDHVFHFR
jgi:hypothetical protein